MSRAKGKTPQTASQAGAAPAADGLPLFYRQPRPLVAERDGGLSLATVADYRFAAGTNSVPVVAAELPMACRHYPILFAPGDAPQPVALLGLRSRENLFVDAEGAWEARAYVPAYVRRYPFIFFESDDKATLTLCIDTAADAVVEDASNPLFANGQPTQVATKALDFCREYQANHLFTVEFGQALRKANLLVDNRADVTLTGGQRLSLSGFQVIDEARFNAMPAEEFLRWRERGWLAAVYCHFVSVGNWAGLVDRAASRGA